MAQDVYENPALAIADCPHNRLVSASFIDSGEDFDVLRRAAEFGVDLILEMMPPGRNASHDRMLRSLGADYFVVLESMVTSPAGSVVIDIFPVFDVEVRPPFFVSSVPSAEAGHLIVGRPVLHGNDGRMDEDHSSASAHVVLESLSGLFRPGLSSIVDDYQAIVLELRRKMVYVGVPAEEVGFDVKLACILENFGQDLRGTLVPVASVLAGNQQDPCL